METCKYVYPPVLACALSQQVLQDKQHTIGAYQTHILKCKYHKLTQATSCMPVNKAVKGN